MKNSSPILIVSDAENIIHTVDSYIQDEFGCIVSASHLQQAFRLFRVHKPRLIIAAFETLVKSEEFYRNLLNRAKSSLFEPHRTIALCKSTEVHMAYEFCRANRIHDYIVNSPLFDPYKLKLAMYHSLQILSNHALSATTAGLANVGTDNKKTVLIVDDDPAYSDLIKAMLAADGYNVINAADGIEAISLLSQNDVDVILMDIGLPGLDGLQAAKIIKLNPSHKDVPIIIISAKNKRSIVKETIQAGAADFIVKPANRELLHHKISSLFNSKTAESEIG